jgi:GR25 family glycosyltransferase involved in LPS biosynthesis
MDKGLNLKACFGGAYVINLENRPDRKIQFEHRAAKAKIVGYEFVRAVHGDSCVPPHWWRAGNGAWGCMMTHLRIAQDAIMDGLKNYVVFEDDVVFAHGFADMMPKILKTLHDREDDWDMLYLGGQHLYNETSPPWHYDQDLVRCNNVNRTHAMVVNARFMVKFCQHIIHAPDYINSETDDHIDHQLGRLHRDYVTLAAQPWLCGQGGGDSSITGNKEKEMWWDDNGWGK